MKPFLRLLLAGSLVAAMTPSLALANILTNADPGQWKLGETPPKPWQHSDRDDGISVRSIEHNNTVWIELRDDSSEKPANLRQEFAPLRAGRLSFRVSLPREHIGEFGVYLGQGSVAAPVERIVEFKTSGRGTVVIGSGGERVDTSASLSPGMNDHFYLDFDPAGHDLIIRLGRINPDNTETLLGEYTALHQAHPVTRLRVTTDNLPRGARILITDLVLSPLP